MRDENGDVVRPEDTFPGHKMDGKLGLAGPYKVLAASQICTNQVIPEAQFSRKTAGENGKNDKSSKNGSENDKNEEKWRELVKIDRAL